MNKAVRSNKRKARTAVRQLNKSLNRDVYGSRFVVKILGRWDSYYEDHSGVDSVYKVGFYDTVSNTGFDTYLDQHHMTSPCTGYSQNLYSIINDFIIRSDFWKTYNSKDMKGGLTCNELPHVC